MLREDLLHYAWKTKKFHLKHLLTTSRRKLELYKFGHHNHDAGPDFLNAHIAIDGTEWFGHIEIHIYASDWIKHNHSQDPAYENVILHVVYENDKVIQYPDGSPIPCLELKDKLPPNLSKKYFRLMASQKTILCQDQINNVDRSLLNIWIEKLGVERLSKKTFYLDQLLEITTGDWKRVFYISLFRSMGAKVNGDAFEQLAHSTPFKILEQLSDDPFKVESILFGQAGLLDFNPRDAYPKSLKKEYHFLAHKYKLTAISRNHWKLLRMRPSNFPTIRIAQLAALICKKPPFFGQVSDLQNIDQLKLLFDCELNPYWDDHYLFDKISKFRIKRIGESMIFSIAINTICPFLFLYGLKQGNDKWLERAKILLTYMPPENNKIINSWEKMNIIANTAWQSQALLHLRKNYCENKKCLDCDIGHAILKPKIS